MEIFQPASRLVRYLWGKKKYTSAQRISCAVALWTIWRSTAEPNPPSYPQVLEQVIQDWLASFNLIKSEKVRDAKWAKHSHRLATKSALWSYDGSMPYISFLAKRFLKAPSKHSRLTRIYTKRGGSVEPKREPGRWGFSGSTTT